MTPARSPFRPASPAAGPAAPVLPRWRPGLGGAALHGEVFAPGGEASGAAFALALALDAAGPVERPWLWVQDRAALRRGGRPYQPGLPPALRHRLASRATRYEAAPISPSMPKRSWFIAPVVLSWYRHVGQI